MIPLNDYPKCGQKIAMDEHNISDREKLESPSRQISVRRNTANPEKHQHLSSVNLILTGCWKTPICCVPLVVYRFNVPHTTTRGSGVSGASHLEILEQSAKKTFSIYCQTLDHL
jgi:hypothetical protein